MKVLIVGSGGREHALCWKIAQSKKIDKLFAAPGNGGMSKIAECVNIKAEDIESLLRFAKEKKIDLTVVGPEAPLVAGIVDKFNRERLRIFGPDKKIAQLEGSKVFAKETMARLKVPTADFMIFDEPDDAMDYIKQKGTPIVIKADGLAAGKGVIVARSIKEAESAIKLIMVDKEFGASGDRVVVEECLEGEEVSIIVISDGKRFVNLAPSQDHKPIYDGDKGPNTGGMGAYSPCPAVNKDMEKKILKETITPLIFGLYEEGMPYKGALYAGLMITKDGPKVLEFNVRFGDPETQAILPRLKENFVEALLASIDGNVGNVNLSWDDRHCVCVVCASEGYPGSYKKGFVINGLEKLDSLSDVFVFHAGTKIEMANGKESLLTNGGRVLGVTALGDGIKDAIDKAYKACGKIGFEGIYYRKDIGLKALKRFK